MTEQAPEPDEPGQVGDPEHGIPGDTEPMPEDDASNPAPETVEEAEEDTQDTGPEEVEDGVEDDEGSDGPTVALDESGEPTPDQPAADQPAGE